MSKDIVLDVFSKSFKRTKNTILNDTRIRINAGERVAIMGKSGVGKTSLLNILGLIDNNYDGNYELFGRNIKSLSLSDHAKIRNEEIGIILQESALINSMSIEDNIKLPLLYYRGQDTKEFYGNFNHLIETMDIGSIINKKPHECSGGQKARAVIARGVIMNPSLVLSDEPTSFLDDKNKMAVMNYLFDLNRKFDTTLITVTHEHDIAEMHDYVINII